MSDRHDDPRAHALRERYHATLGGEKRPVPVERIAGRADRGGHARSRHRGGGSACQPVLTPGERRILVNAAESEPRGRFNTHEERLA
jgi:hypothetical protein